MPILFRLSVFLLSSVVTKRRRALLCQSGRNFCWIRQRNCSYKKVKVGRGRRKTTCNAGIVRRVKLRFNAESCGSTASIHPCSVEASPAYRRCWTQPGCVGAVTPWTDILFLINVDLWKIFVIAMPAWNFFASFQPRLKRLQYFMHQLFCLFYRWWCHLCSSF